MCVVAHSRLKAKEAKQSNVVDGTELDLEFQKKQL